MNSADSVNSRRQVLWWSRSGREYSRNRIVRQAFEQLGWVIRDFIPKLSPLGDWQAWLQRVATPDLVWVPCFRHRDAAAAVRWSRARRVPVMFDPLISSYDKEVFEKERFPEGSLQARRLQSWEASLMNRFDTVIADTQCHVEFYCSCFGLHPEKIRVIPVGAEERLFLQQPFRADHERVRVLFYGSFIGLQGPEVIAEAARMTPSVDWMFVGDGPLRARCERICGELPNITFIPWIPYEELPRTISQADILLGVFGASLKASRVIPNKVYQALACGRMVVTQDSAAYPAALRSGSTMETGLKLIPSGSASRIADAVQDLAGQPKLLPALGDIARKRYEQFFSQSVITESLRSAVAHIDRRP